MIKQLAAAAGSLLLQRKACSCSWQHAAAADSLQQKPGVLAMHMDLPATWHHVSTMDMYVATARKKTRILPLSNPLVAHTPLLDTTQRLKPIFDNHRVL